jgi:D-beta-D-heptose 7-phosphate kinase/D-beta-D-heptose 1-phosphate adenosyltransferase
MKRLMVIGDLMIDHYVYGTVDRISPEAPVPVLERESESRFLGGAGLVATSIRNLGAEVDVITVVGDDDMSLVAKELLKREKMAEGGLVTEEKRKTTVKNRFVATSPYFQMLLRVDSETRSPVSAATEKRVIANIESASEKCDAMVISDYNKGMLSGKIIEHAISCAKRSGKPLIVDTKRSMFDYKGAGYLVPNFRELCLAFGLKASNDDDTILPHATKLSLSLGSTVIVKRSAKGATIAEGKKIRTCPAQAADVINVSGAGDIFVSVFSFALASGQSVDDCVKLAIKACGRAISRKHPSVSADDLE